MVGNQSFLATGLAQTSASNAALILALVPLTTSVLAVMFLGDRLTLLRTAGIALALIGIAFVILEGNDGLGGMSLGDLFIFCAMFSQAFSFIWIKKATETLDAKQATAIMLTMGAVFLFLISLFLEPSGTSQLNEGTVGVWTVFVLSAVLATGLGHMLYNTAIHRLGAGQSSIFMNLQPFFSLLGSALFLGESIVSSQILGFLFIVAGVILGTGYVDERLKRSRDQSQYVKKDFPG